jgi:hypothetical protein
MIAALVLAVAAGVVAFGVLVHEEGHLLAARLLGYDARLTWRWQGPGVEWSGARARVRDRALVTAAGPAASAVAGVVLWPLFWPFAVLVAMVGVAQLVPLPYSDGARLLSLAVRGG